MNLKEIKLRNFLLELYENIKLESIDFQTFKEDSNILVIRSASIDIFEKCIRNIREINPQIFIYVITHSRDKETIANICKEKYEIIENHSEGKYELKRLQQSIEYLNDKEIDKSILLYNNCYGMGFENVEEILMEIKSKSIYAINCYSTLFKINNPKLHIESLKLFNNMCTWFWEYLGQEERE